MQFYQTTSYVYSISYQIVQIPFCCTETVVAAKSALNSSNSVAMSRGIDKKVPQNSSSVRCRISWSIFMTRINTTAFLLFPTACLCHRTYPYCPLPPLHSYSSTETHIKMYLSAVPNGIGTVTTTAYRSKAESCIQISSKNGLRKLLVDFHFLPPLHGSLSTKSVAFFSISIKFSVTNEGSQHRSAAYLTAKSRWKNHISNDLKITLVRKSTSQDAPQNIASYKLTNREAFTI